MGKIFKILAEKILNKVFKIEKIFYKENKMIAKNISHYC